MLRHVSWPVNACLLSAGSLAAVIATFKAEPKDRRRRSMHVVIPIFVVLFLVIPLLFLSWIEGAELRQQARYWQRKMDEQYCRQVLATLSGKNLESFVRFRRESRKH